MYNHLTAIAADMHRQRLMDEAASYRQARSFRTPKLRRTHRSARPLTTRWARVLPAH